MNRRQFLTGSTAIVAGMSSGIVGPALRAVYDVGAPIYTAPIGHTIVWHDGASRVWVWEEGAGAFVEMVDGTKDLNSGRNISIT